MKFEVHLTRAAAKDLDRLGSDAERSQVIAALRNLETNPDAGRALAGDLAGFYSLHLTLPSGQARVIYSLFQDRLVILVIALGMRESIYRDGIIKGIERITLETAVELGAALGTSSIATAAVGRSGSRTACIRSCVTASTAGSGSSSGPRYKKGPVRSWAGKQSLARTTPSWRSSHDPV